jgi:hypothetical protein
VVGAEHGAYRGEIDHSSTARTRSATLNGVARVFREDGLTPDGMVEALRQDPDYSNGSTTSTTCSMRWTMRGEPVTRSSGRVPGTRELRAVGIKPGEAWWTKGSWRTPKVEPGETSEHDIPHDADTDFNPEEFEAKPDIPAIPDTGITGVPAAKIEDRQPENEALPDTLSADERNRWSVLIKRERKGALTPTERTELKDLTHRGTMDATKAHLESQTTEQLLAGLERSRTGRSSDTPYAKRQRTLIAAILRDRGVPVPPFDGSASPDTTPAKPKSAKDMTDEELAAEIMREVEAEQKPEEPAPRLPKPGDMIAANIGRGTQLVEVTKVTPDVVTVADGNGKTFELQRVPKPEPKAAAPTDKEKFDAAARGVPYQKMSGAELRELLDHGVGDEPSLAAAEIKRRQDNKQVKRAKPSKDRETTLQQRFEGVKRIGTRVTADEGTGTLQRLDATGDNAKIALEPDGKLTNWIPLSRVRAADELGEWFGDSKVVDAAGRPLVVYRGRAAGAPEQIQSSVGYFTDNREHADEYSRRGEDGEPSNVFAAYLRIEKPARDADVRRIAAAKGISLTDEAHPAAYLGEQPALVSALKAAGFDGAIGADRRFDDRGSTRSYAVFDAAQVRPAATTAPADRPNTDLDAKKAENAAKREELFKKLRGKLTSGVDPTDVVTMVQILRTYLDDGITEGRRAWRAMKADAPDLAGKLVRHFEIGWEKLTGEKVNVAVFDDLAPESKGTSREVPADQRAVKLLSVLRDNLDAIKKDPREMRKFAQTFLGGDPTTYTDDITDAIEAALTANAPKLGEGHRLKNLIAQANALEERLPRASRSLEKLDLQQFSTPLPLAVAAQYAAHVQSGDRILEPTAGTGHLVSALDPTKRNILVRELSERRASLLKALGYHTTQGDYLAMTEKAEADVIITNPPWGKYTTGKYGQGIALGFSPRDVAERFVAKNVRDLNDGGRLVAIMPTTMLKSPAFTHFLGKNGTIRAVIQSPPDAYDTRSTTVDSLLLVWDKAAVGEGATVFAVGDHAPKNWQEYADLVASIPARTVTEGRRADERPAQSTPEPAPAAVGGRRGTVRSGPAQSGGDAPVGSPGVSGGRHPAVVADGEGRPAVAPKPAAPRLAREDDRDATRGLSAAGRLAYEHAAASTQFAPYRLRSDLAGQRHPKLVVEARALSGVPYPELTIQPTDRVRAIVQAGRASIEQAEQALAAVQANIVGHHGYLAADNVGVGKSREIALTILDLMERAKAEKRPLRLMVTTFNRDTIAGLIDNEMLKEVLAGEDPGFEIVKVPDHKGAKKDGTEYEPLPRYEHAIYVVDSYNLREYRQALLDVGLHGIIGDEVHTYKNSDAGVGAAWQTLHSQIMLHVPRPDQAFAYFTATPAQSVYDYRYLFGLREWPIDGFEDWVNAITGKANEEQAKKLKEDTEAGATNPDRLDPGAAPGVGGDSEDTEKGDRKKWGSSGESVFQQTLTPGEAEQIPREWKVKGKFSSRDLWREGTEFVVDTRSMAPKHVTRYNGFAQLARDIMAAHKQFGAMDKSGQRSTFGPTSALQNAAKRFQMQPAIEEAIQIAKEHLAQGYQPVLSLINVNEADPESGNIRAAIEQINTREVDKTEDGDIVDIGDIPEAIIRKAELLEQAKELGVLDNPLDLVTDAFGEEKVALIVGDQGKLRSVHNKEFQAGKRPVAVISAAGTTGINLDHVVETPIGAKGRRVFIDVQYEWSASKAVQRYGRVDRSSSITPPKIVALNFGSASEKKFLATVANRMASLGALSKGGSESTGASALEEFEITGQDSLTAAREAWDLLSDDDKAYWTSRVFRDPADPTRPARHTEADMRQIQLALLFVPIDKANAFWESFLAQRERIREAMGYLDERRAARYTGTVLRSVTLDNERTLTQVKNDNHEKFGILSGVVMTDMPKLRELIRDPQTGGARRRYVTFTAHDGTVVAGLEIPWTRTPNVARLYGKMLKAEKLDTPAKVREALAAGDHVPLQQDPWQLRQRNDGKIAIDGAKMADRAAVLKYGGAYSQVGNFWHVVDLDKFLDRFPAKHPDVSLSPDEDGDQQGLLDVADSRGQAGMGGIGKPIRTKPQIGPVQTQEPGIAKMPGYESSLLLEKLGEAGPLTNTPRPQDGMVRPIQFPELVSLAEDLASTPHVVKRFRGAETRRVPRRGSGTDSAPRRPVQEGQHDRTGRDARARDRPPDRLVAEPVPEARQPRGAAVFAAPVPARQVRHARRPHNSGLEDPRRAAAGVRRVAPVGPLEGHRELPPVPGKLA